MFDHVTIRVTDRATSERFYTSVLIPLGVETSYRTNAFTEWQDFSLAEADAASPVTRRLHVAFVAPSREQVDEFWRVGTEAGHTSDGPPGPRPQYSGDYYGSFLLDPDGNSVEAVHRSGLRRGGIIDHLWIRVRDVAASRRFYTTIAPHAELALGADTAERVQFRRSNGSFSLVAGPPSENVHLAFATADDGAVQAFHQAATDAGFRSNGAPGERARYHPGYYAAYLLDPDGNNVELVNHHRG